MGGYTTRRSGGSRLREMGNKFPLGVGLGGYLHLVGLRAGMGGVGGVGGVRVCQAGTGVGVDRADARCGVAQSDGRREGVSLRWVRLRGCLCGGVVCARA